MSSWEKELRDKAKQQAKNLITRAAKDGKISKGDFKDAASRNFYNGGSTFNNTYMANEIARALKDDPTLTIGKKASELTGVKLGKNGALTHAFNEDRSAPAPDSQGQAFYMPGRAAYDKGSANWVQNSRGSYTYIGDLPARQKKEEPIPEQDATQDPETKPDPFAGLRDDNTTSSSSSSGGTSNGGSGSGNGSIHFNPLADAIQASANFGNDSTDDYFRRFLPESFAYAQRGSDEIGASAQYHLNRLLTKAPEPGDAKELFKYYKGKIG